MTKTHRKRILALLLLGLLLVWMLFPPMARSRSLTVMRIYDFVQERKAQRKELGLEVEIPIQSPLTLGGKQYSFLPVMNTFEASQGLSDQLGRPVRFSIDYAVPDFEKGPLGLRRSWSAFYDPNHPFYNSYVGCYFLSGGNTPMDLAAAAKVLEFDLRSLALPALGVKASDVLFSLGQVRGTGTAEISGMTWTRYDAELITNGPQHKAERFQTGYLQFGLPPASGADSLQYPSVKMYGRFYMIWLPEKDLNLALYAMASSPTALEVLSSSWLEQTRISTGTHSVP